MRSSYLTKDDIKRHKSVNIINTKKFSSSNLSPILKQDSYKKQNGRYGSQYLPNQTLNSASFLKSPVINQRISKIQNDSEFYNYPSQTTIKSDVEKRQEQSKIDKQDKYNALSRQEKIKQKTQKLILPNLTKQDQKILESKQNQQKQKQLGIAAQKQEKIDNIMSRIKKQYGLNYKNDEAYFNENLKNFQNLQTFVDIKQALKSLNIFTHGNFENGIEALKLKDKINEIEEELNQFTKEFGQTGEHIDTVNIFHQNKINTNQIQKNLQNLLSLVQQLVINDKKFMKNVQKNQNGLIHYLQEVLQQKNNEFDDLKDDQFEFYMYLQDEYYEEKRKKNIENDMKHKELALEQQQKEEALRALFKQTYFDYKGENKEKRPNQSYFNKYHQLADNIIKQASQKSRGIFIKQFNSNEDGQELRDKIERNKMLQGSPKNKMADLKPKKKERRSIFLTHLPTPQRKDSLDPENNTITENSDSSDAESVKKRESQNFTQQYNKIRLSQTQFNSPTKFQRNNKLQQPSIIIQKNSDSKDQSYQKQKHYHFVENPQNNHMYLPEEFQTKVIKQLQKYQNPPKDTKGRATYVKIPKRIKRVTQANVQLSRKLSILGLSETQQQLQMQKKKFDEEYQIYRSSSSSSSEEKIQRPSSISSNTDSISQASSIDINKGLASNNNLKPKLPNKQTTSNFIQQNKMMTSSRGSCYSKNKLSLSNQGGLQQQNTLEKVLSTNDERIKNWVEFQKWVKKTQKQNEQDSQNLSNKIDTVNLHIEKSFKKYNLEQASSLYDPAFYNSHINVKTSNLIAKQNTQKRKKMIFDGLAHKKANQADRNVDNS